MRVKDIQAGKTYYGRRGSRAHRAVLAILPFDAAAMAGRVRGANTYDDELVVRYRTNSATPRVEYLWLTQFAHWVGAEVGRIRVPKREAAGMQTLQLTEDVNQDATTPDGAVAYLVFTDGEEDYKVFTDQSEAVATALDVAVSRGVNEQWRVYPLYAGPPITG